MQLVVNNPEIMDLSLKKSIEDQTSEKTKKSLSFSVDRLLKSVSNNKNEEISSSKIGMNLILQKTLKCVDIFLSTIYYLNFISRKYTLKGNVNL